MEYKDYYQILGIERDATADAIKQAYRKLARKYHPDVNKDKDAEARFKDIGEAYEVLKDPEKRSAYDRFGANWQNGEQFRPPPDWNAGGYEFRGSAPGDTQGFSDFFEALFGQTRGRGSYAGQSGQGFSMQGEDQQAAITISLEDAYHGAKQTLTLNRPEPDEQGRIFMRPQQLNLAIPKGIIAGQRIRLEGQGLPGHGGGAPGDLYLEIHFAPHHLFKAEKRTIHLQLPVTPWEAALGASITVPTLDGKVQLKIPPNSQNGRKLRLKGKGLSTQKTTGDQIVTLQVVLPEAQTEEQQAIYRSMAEKLAFNPRTDLGV
ncbi:MAG: DnaJ C-terminal domain-containing protein [bacterium]|nr:DnaJ C-terminal domain-containing protein [bacterium]